MSKRLNPRIQAAGAAIRRLSALWRALPLTVWALLVDDPGGATVCAERVIAAALSHDLPAIVTSVATLLVLAGPTYVRTVRALDRRREPSAKVDTVEREGLRSR